MTAEAEEQTARPVVEAMERGKYVHVVNLEFFESLGTEIFIRYI